MPRPDLRNPHSLLFARYVAGQFEDLAWTRIMALLDADATTGDARSALAGFLSDCPGALDIPAPDEATAFMDDVFAAAPVEFA